MKNILISCVSLFKKDKTVEKNGRPKQPIVYSSGDITINALQTNEACEKFLLKKLACDGCALDMYIRVQSSSVEHDDFTMTYLDNSIAEFCASEGLSIPAYIDCFLGEDEKEHRYDRMLNEISTKIREIAEKDTDISIYLDMAGGKRDNYIFIQLLTKLLSYYDYKVHSYYADITDTSGQGTIVNTDLSFRHMKILDAVNVFIQFGSVTPLRDCFKDTKSRTVKDLLKAMEEFSNSLQLCSTDLVNIIPRLNQQLDQTEKNVSYDTDDLFVIGTMLPLIRQKFDIKVDGSGRGTLNIIKWCLENNLIQQALTIYNEKAVDLLFSENMISINTKIHGHAIDKLGKGTHPSKRNATKLLYILSEAFDNMCKNPKNGPKDMAGTIDRYKKSRYNNRESDKKGNIEWTIGASFFDKKYLPEGITLNGSAKKSL